VIGVGALARRQLARPNVGNDDKERLHADIEAVIEQGARCAVHYAA
jgi:hypothetical protein